jgi:hypothetical protein
MMDKMGQVVAWCVLFLLVLLSAAVAAEAPAAKAAAPAAPNTSTWYSGALAYNKSPVDLSAMNHKPAGKYGFVHADGDRLVFENGQEARFWGGNVAAYALFDANKSHVQVQAKRIAQLGYNLMRLHHMDSTGWVDPTVIDKTLADTQHLSAAGMDEVDYWIKSLRDQGVYVWLDMHVGRVLKAGDTIPGFDEVTNYGGGPSGFTYYNTRVEELMRIFSVMYLSHVNPYTGLAYKDDPAIIGMELTNEDDVTNHYGNLMLADKNNPYHNAIFNRSVSDFCALTGLPTYETGQTWLAGPSKIYLNDVEHAWDVRMLDTLTSIGVRVPIATTQMWGGNALFSLPALTAGGIVDTHSYGDVGALSTNPRTAGNFVTYIALGQAYGKPLSTTEWNVPFPATDRFTAPLYVASIAALQGWDAPMIYNYSQDTFNSPSSQTTWSTFSDVALTGLMPAAAVLFRQGHVHQARQRYCLLMDRNGLYYQANDTSTMATVRTLVERSHISIGMPDIPELTWDSATRITDGSTTITNVNQDFIPAGQNYVDSDTGELRRDWAVGFQTINTSGTQAAQGVLTTRTIVLSRTTIRVTTTPQAAVAVTALDRRPLGRSRRILVTALARAVGTGSGANRMPMRSEPVTGSVTMAAPAGLEMLPLANDGTFLAKLTAPYTSGTYTLSLPAPVGQGTHWFMLQDDPALAQPGLASCPPVVTAAAVPVTFDGATTGTSGLKRIELWYSLAPAGTWTDSTLTTSALAGTFRFLPPGNVTGIYRFQLVAVSNNDVRSAAPDGPGDCATLFDSVPPSVVSVRALARPTTGTQPFDVKFSEPVTGFDSPGDVTIGHTGTTAHTGVTVVPMSPTEYIVSVLGLSGRGTYSLSVKAGACMDEVGWPNVASPPLILTFPPPPPKRPAAFLRVD